MITDAQVEAAAAVLYARKWADYKFSSVEMEDLRAALEAADPAAWQPIKKVPPNTSVLIWLPRSEHYGPGIYRAIYVDTGSDRRWHVTTVAMGRDLDPRDFPLLWRPLPLPPKEEGDPT